MPRPAFNWRSLLDADDLPPAAPKPVKHRSVTESLAFHRAQSRREAQEQRTLALLTGSGSATGRGSLMSYASDGHRALGPLVAGLQIAGEAPAAPPPPARRIPGPPPPKSWTSPLPASVSSSAAGRSSSVGAGADAASRLPVELDHFTRAHLGAFADVHPSQLAPGQPPRLLVSAHLILLRRLETSAVLLSNGDADVDGAEQAREDVAGLPRHLRELALWGIPCWTGRGVSAREVEALLWDIRAWDEDDDDERGGPNGGQERSNGASCDTCLDDSGGGDDWESSSSSSSQSNVGSSDGWPTLYLPACTLPLSTLRLLLAPLPSSGFPTPVTHLSLAHSPWPLERLLAVLPAHLRALSLEGVLFAPVDNLNGGASLSSSAASDARVKSLLVRLARATPLLQYLDLSSVHPPLSPALLAAADGVHWRSQWRALATLVVKGLRGTDGLKAREVERDVRWAMGDGRGWVEVVVE